MRNMSSIILWCVENQFVGYLFRGLLEVIATCLEFHKQLHTSYDQEVNWLSLSRPQTNRVEKERSL